MNERIKELRKSLGLSQEKFGFPVGVKKVAVSQWESGNFNIPDRAVLSICREYHVSEQWLRTGEGDMFVETDDEYASMIDQIMEGEDGFAKNVFKTFAQFDESDWAALKKMIDTYLEVSEQSEDSVGDLADLIPDTPEELEAMYKVDEDADRDAG